MKKIIFIICIVFLTGCDVTYNLDINDSFIENVSVVEDDFDNWYYTFSGMSMIEYNSYFLSKEIPYHYDDNYMPEINYRFDDVSYYDVSDLSTDDVIGMSLNSNFKDIESYSRSNLVWSGSVNKNIRKDDNYIHIDSSNFKVFSQYSILNNLTVKLKSKYKAVSNNADEIDGNVYIWNIDRSNYLDKKIDITYDISSDLSKEVKKNPIIGFSILLVLLFLIGILIFVFVNGKHKKNNAV